MLKTENTAVMNMENAMRGARNPLNSWAKMDSYTDPQGVFHFGENDLDLARRLCAAGSDHRKFIRQIFVSVDITAPIYWWKEYDTYKVATVANSTSTMHKIHARPFALEDFSTDHMDAETLEEMQRLVGFLEKLRLKYMENKDKQYWYDMIQLLPSSYNQMRTCTPSERQNALAAVLCAFAFYFGKTLGCVFCAILGCFVNFSENLYKPRKRRKIQSIIGTIILFGDSVEFNLRA